MTLEGNIFQLWIIFQSLMHFILITACFLYSEAELILLIVLYNDVLCLFSYRLDTTASFNGFIIFLWKVGFTCLMVEMNIRMLSVSQSMANRKTFQQFALRNSEIVSVMDYSNGLVLKVHFLVTLGFFDKFDIAIDSRG